MLRQIIRNGRKIQNQVRHKVPILNKGIDVLGSGAIASLQPKLQRTFCSSHQTDPLGLALIDAVTYETVCSETLESLCDYFDELIESTPELKLADVTFGDGVLTVNFGNLYGTYVINRQSPNRQIWLSSPKSGPKRYDFVPSSADKKNGFWLYKHEGITLHELLQMEINQIAKTPVDFLSLSHGKRM